MAPKEKLEADNSKPNQEAILFTNQSKEYVRLRNAALKKLIDKEYEQLKTALESYQTNYIKDFFLQEGQIILRWTLMNAKDTGPLSFLVDNIPPDLLKKIISNNNYYIFKSFLAGECCLEKTQYNTEVNNNIRIEKFKILLSLDAKGIIEVIQQKDSEPYATNWIKEQIGIAHDKYKRSQAKP